MRGARARGMHEVVLPFSGGTTFWSVLICLHHPYFGTREFPVEFQLWQESGDPVGFEHGHRDLGYMLYDFDYRNPAHPAPLFFRAELDDGVLDVESVEVRS